MIADLRLTGIHGVEGLDIVQWSRHLRPETRVVLLTGNATPEIEAEARRRGADAFLQKPLPLPQLEAIVDGLVGRPRERGVSLPIVCAWCERVRTSAGRWEAAGDEPRRRAGDPRHLPRVPVGARRARPARRASPVETERRAAHRAARRRVLLPRRRLGAARGDAADHRAAPATEAKPPSASCWASPSGASSASRAASAVFQEAQGRVDSGERRQFERFEVTLPVRISRIATWRDPSAQTEETLAEVIAAGGALVQSRMAIEKGEMIRFAVGEAYDTRAEVMYVSLARSRARTGSSASASGFSTPRCPRR